MKTHIGEEGTEQFTVTTRVNSVRIGEQAIHDPFIRTYVRLRGLRHAWKALTCGIDVEVCVDGSHGATRAVMMLDPSDLQADTEVFLREMAQRRESSDCVGYYGEQPS